MELTNSFCLLLAFLVACAIAGCGGGGSAPASKAEQVSMYGDSLSYGSYEAQGAVQRLDPPPAKVLASLLDTAVLDFSAPGTQSLNALKGDPPAPFKPYAEQIQADPSPVVLIRYGGADALLGVSAADTEARVTQLVDLALAQHKRVVLTGISHISPDAPHDVVAAVAAADAAIFRVARQRGVHFIDVRSVPFYGAGDLADLVHPGRDYSDRITQAIAQQLR